MSLLTPKWFPQGFGGRSAGVSDRTASPAAHGAPAMRRGGAGGGSSVVAGSAVGCIGSEHAAIAGEERGSRLGRSGVANG